MSEAQGLGANRAHPGWAIQEMRQCQQPERIRLGGRRRQSRGPRLARVER